MSNIALHMSLTHRGYIVQLSPGERAFFRYAFRVVYPGRPDVRCCLLGAAEDHLALFRYGHTCKLQGGRFAI